MAVLMEEGVPPLDLVRGGAVKAPPLALHLPVGDPMVWLVTHDTHQGLLVPAAGHAVQRLLEHEVGAKPFDLDESHRAALHRLKSGGDGLVLAGPAQGPLLQVRLERAGGTRARTAATAAATSMGRWWVSARCLSCWWGTGTVTQWQWKTEAWR